MQNLLDHGCGPQALVGLRPEADGESDMSKWMICFLMAFALIAAPTAWSQDKKAKGIDKMFKKLDKDGNGSISLEEFKAQAKGKEAKAAKLEKRFKKLDADGDGALSKEELAKGMGKKGGKKKKKNKEDDN